MTRINAIPTKYQGVQYRSRLEAKYAAFFDNIGWQHSYEPFDFNGYIPDFLIHGDRPFLIEVKDAVTQHDYYEHVPKIERALKSSGKMYDLLIVGIEPVTTVFDSDFGNWNDHPFVGLLGQCWEDEPSWDFNPGVWIECSICSKNVVIHTIMSFIHSPCNHYNGDTFGEANINIVQNAWRTATNMVQWKPNSKVVDREDVSNLICPQCGHDVEHFGDKIFNGETYNFYGHVRRLAAAECGVPISDYCYCDTIPCRCGRAIPCHCPNPVLIKAITANVK